MDQRPKKTVFVSNLNLQTTDNEFEEAFKRFGTVKKAFVVKDNRSGDGPKSRGFGYVIFEKADDFQKCVKSKVTLGGRNLKICKAKPKIYNKNKKGNDDEEKEGEEEEEDEDEDSGTPKKIIKSKVKDGHMKKTQKDNDDEDDDSDDGDDDDDDDVKVNSKVVRVKKTKQRDDDGSDDDDEEEEDMECEDESMECDDDDGEEEGDQEDDDEDEDDDDEEDYDDDDDDDEDDEGEEEDEGEAPKTDRVLNNNDAEDGRTLFIRNLSFDSVEDDLDEFFEEFGELNYCRIVVDQKSQRSRGMAFVRFRRKESADKCLEEFKSNPEKFTITGRALVLALAVTKDEAKNKFQKQIGEESGSKRNLHLIRVTMIRPGTQAAEGMTNEDIQMRENVLAATKEKLKNPNIFVSPNRLCVRNIPFDVDDKKLKFAFLKAAGGGKEVKITESRIMRDLTKPRANGVCWSKGFGFVSFKSHEHALAAALATNNVPLFGQKMKLIVDFSLENKAVYELRQKRLEKSRNPVPHSKNSKSDDNNSSNNYKKNRNDNNKNKNKKFQMPDRVPNQNPGKKHLPSHSGAKIRHKPRDGGMTKNKKNNNKKEGGGGGGGGRFGKNKQPFKKTHKEGRPEKAKESRKRKRRSVKEYSDNVDVLIKKRRLERS